MAYRELEVSLLSAQDLKNVNLITRMDVYAVASISGNPLTQQCTAPDTYGGRNPCWDATFRFAVPPTAAAAAAAGASLHVLLRAERFLGDRDVGEVVVPLSDVLVLAGASGAGPQPPQVASYQVRRKAHRWEPRGVLNVSYRLGPVVAPVVVVERAPGFNAYAPVGGVPRQPSYHHPSAVAYQAPPAPGRPAVRVAEPEHDDAAQKSPVMAYPAGVPPQQASHPAAKPEAYRPPTPPPPRPAAVHAAAGHEEAPAPTPAPPPRNGGRSNGLGQPGPTHVYMGPHSQIIFGGLPAGKKGDDGNWALLKDTQGNYASSAESMSIISPRRKEDSWRPSSVLSQSQHEHDTEEQQQQAASSPVAVAAAAAAAARSSSSSSSPLSPYTSAHPSPYFSAHSSRSPYSYSARPSTTTSPQPPLRPPAVSDDAEVTRGSAISSPLPSSSPMVRA